MGKKVAAQTNEYYVTQLTVKEDQLPKLVGKRLFFISPKIDSVTIRFVHCFDILLMFQVSFLSALNSAKGSVRFIVDDRIGCGFADGNVNIKCRPRALSPDMLAVRRFTRERAEKMAYTDARWKVLMLKYKKPADLSTISIGEFWRPYYQVFYRYSQKQYERWVAADDYSNYMALM